MTVYIGVDFHARQQTISYLTTEDGEIKRGQLDHARPEEVRRFYQQFAGQRVVVGFESSGPATWFEDCWRNWVAKSGSGMRRRFERMRGAARRTTGATLI